MDFTFLEKYYISFMNIKTINQFSFYRNSRGWYLIKILKDELMYESNRQKYFYWERLHD